MAQGPLVVSAPREMVAKKPRYGSPCNNCGLCCHSSKCDIGRALFGASDGPCPALRFDAGGSSYCNVIAEPAKYTTHDPEKARAAAMLLTYSGKGCTMRINGERNESFLMELWAFDAWKSDELDAAAALWGLPPRFIDLPF